jgi:hypothetical protein
MRCEPLAFRGQGIRTEATVQERTPHDLLRPKPLKMQEPGNRVFRFRLILGQDGQSISVSLADDVDAERERVGKVAIEG